LQTRFYQTLEIGSALVPPPAWWAWPGEFDPVWYVDDDAAARHVDLAYDVVQGREQQLTVVAAHDVDVV